MEWLRIQFDAGNTNILYVVFADLSGNTKSPENTPVERRIMLSALINVLNAPVTAEIDANITGFFDIVTALLTQILSFLADFDDHMDHGQ